MEKHKILILIIKKSINFFKLNLTIISFAPLDGVQLRIKFLNM